VVLGNRIQSAIQKPLLHIAQPHVETGSREHVGNAVAHGPRPDDSDPLHGHDCLALNQPRLRLE